MNPAATSSILSDKRAPLFAKSDLAVVVGAGVSGEAAARLLAHLGAKVRLLDRKAGNISAAFAALAEKEGIEIICGDHTPEQFMGAALVVTSPGVPLPALERLLAQAGDNAPVQAAGPARLPLLIGELELASRYTDEPILAITGTSGKTTTTSLADAMLRKSGFATFIGGNIGTPLSAHVLARLRGECEKKDVLVLEVSSFQLQTCHSFHPKAAVLLNLTENHLDHHADMDEYTGAKLNVFSRQTPDDFAVVHPDLETLCKSAGCKARIEAIRPQNRFPNLKLIGGHNAFNAEAAWLAVAPFGADKAKAAEAAGQFAPIEHRLELVAEFGGARYVNDSKCTTVDALKVALQSFADPVILLAGGKFKGGDLASLGELVKQRVKSVILFGDSRDIFTRAWDGIVPISWHPGLAPAVQEAAQTAASGDVVLMSPATASFDLFANYKERGDTFRRLAKELK